MTRAFSEGLGTTNARTLPSGRSVATTSSPPLLTVCANEQAEMREAGWGNAMRYLLTADEFGAAEALRMGLVQEVTEPGKQLERAVAIAERIAAQAPLGVQATLRSARLSIMEGEAQAAARVRDDMPGILASDDFREGLASFRERRAASFLGK